MKRRQLFAISSLLLATSSLSAIEYPDFALGADVSWTKYIEANNLHRYYKTADVTVDNSTTITDMVADNGIDAIRLRVWVDPNNAVAKAGFKFTIDGWSADVMSTFGTCSPNDMAELAARFSELGCRIMVVFQMSDTWADPGRQFIPASWSDCTDVDDLAERASGHVTEVLSLLKEKGVNLAWAQIGNEVNTGMLKWLMPKSASGTQTVAAPSWGCTIESNGSATKNFVTVFASAAKAARDIYPQVKTVLHLAKGPQWNQINWTLNALKKAGFNSEMCDYVGLSVYPGLEDGTDEYTADWKSSVDGAITSIANINRYYGYRSLICEMGMNNEWTMSGNAHDAWAEYRQAECIAQCNTDVAACTQYLIDNLAEESSCDGLFYWEPETDYMNGYTKGACVSADPGKSWPRFNVCPNAWWSTIKANSKFTSVDAPTNDALSAAEEYFNLQGISVCNPRSGLYIRRIGSTVEKVIIK